jgi:triosephosphate isomerase (TIM)
MPEKKAPQQRRDSASASGLRDRRPLVAANWKMHKTVAETEAFLDRFVSHADELEGVAVMICPPYPSLATAVERTRRSPLRIAAQNVHEQESGAFTGEVSIPMLLELGVAGSVVGHSERRQLFCETDEALARKVPALLEAGLVPVLCVGESDAQRDAGDTEAVLERQLTADLAAVEESRLAEVVIAYEPIWAIGTGRTATPEQAQEACAFARSIVARRAEGAAERIRVLYGGSVKPDNAAELFAQADIDGGLVGGASLDPDDFLAVCRGAL